MKDALSGISHSMAVNCGVSLTTKCLTRVHEDWCCVWYRVRSGGERCCEGAGSRRMRRVERADDGAGFVAARWSR